MRKQKTDIGLSACPCGTGRVFNDCCGPCLAGEHVPGTAEQLMRSRYTAFVMRDQAYLLSTWHPEQRPSRVRFTPGLRWLGLRIIATVAGGAADTEGTVEFVARHKILGRGHRLHEISRFVREDGRWYYRDGVHVAPA